MGIEHVNVIISAIVLLIAISTLVYSICHNRRIQKQKRYKQLLKEFAVMIMSEYMGDFPIAYNGYKNSNQDSFKVYDYIYCNKELKEKCDELIKRNDGWQGVNSIEDIIRIDKEYRKLIGMK